MGRPLDAKISAAGAARYEGNRTGKRKVGRCVLQTRAEGNFRKSFSLNNLRLREIEQLIKARHGRIVPENDDDAYIVAAAHALNPICREAHESLDVALDGWCHRWMPWALPRAAELIRPALLQVQRRKHDLGADEVARLLAVTNWERTGQEFKTIGACDIPTEIRLAIAANEKRRKDRERLSAKRRAAGVQPREEWLGANRLSERRPWEAAGVSRSKWYRDNKPGMGPSRVEVTRTTCDTLVPKPSPLSAPVAVLVRSSGTASSLQSPSTAVRNGSRDGNQELIRMGVAS